VHWARLEASALGSLIAACLPPMEEKKRREGEVSDIPQSVEYISLWV